MLPSLPLGRILGEHFKLGITQDAITKANKNRLIRDWKSKKRIESPAFKKKEAAYRAKYDNFTRLCRLFAKKYPDAFKLFCIAHSNGVPPAPISRSTPAMLPTTQPLVIRSQSTILNDLGIALD
jgi:hypothetical protein